MTVNRVEIKIQKEVARNYFARRMNISCRDELDPGDRGGYREKFLDSEKRGTALFRGGWVRHGWVISPRYREALIKVGGKRRPCRAGDPKIHLKIAFAAVPAEPRGSGSCGIDKRRYTTPRASCHP